MTYSRLTFPTVAAALALTFGSAHVALGMSSDTTAPAAQADDYKAAVALNKDGKYAEAIPLLKKSISEKGEYADALNQLGFAYRKSGDWKLGMENYLKALKLEPAHLGANEYLGELYLEQKDLENAARQLAVLQGACGDCEEYRTLEAAIGDYKKANNIN